MKIAKIGKKGEVQCVWPWVKTLPDGTTVTKELPPQYRPEKLGRYPDCIKEVPDDTKPGWVWHEDERKWGPKVKLGAVSPHSDLLEVVSEKLNVPYDDLWNEVMARKKARKKTAKDEMKRKARGLDKVNQIH